MDYTISKCERGILSPEEVHFFYYDIMRNQVDSIQCVYEWNKDVQNYLDSRGIVVEVREINDLPKTFEKNRLYFAIDSKSDKDNKAVAFFRHLRNAFVHIRIASECGYLNITDGSYKGKKENKYLEKTMIGQIRYEDLKELCFIFFEQGEKLREENNAL